MIITGPVQIQPLQAGVHGNAWNNVAVPNAGLSAVIDLRYQTIVSIFGSANGNTTISIQASQDGTNFYTVGTLAGINGTFGTTTPFGARFMRLSNGSARTLTVTVAGK